MVPLRKERAGSCNLGPDGGYKWPEDGSVIDVTPEHAEKLLAVPDGDFTAVDAEPTDEAQPEPPEPEAAPADTAIEEPAPAAEFSEAPPPRKVAAKKVTARKTAAGPESAPAVEE